MISKSIINNNKKKTKASKVKFEENNQKLIIINKKQKRIAKIKIDGGVIKNKECCDYIAEFDNTALYIELKGSDIKKACNQILSTIKIFATLHKNRILKSAIVHTRHPKTTTALQKAALNIKKATGSAPIKSRSPLEYPI